MTERVIDGYIRVSAVRGRSGPSYISPTEQRAAIERWAAYKHVTIAEWHVDEDQSGGTHNRPGLEAAIKRAVSGETGGIVAARIDRFSRLTELGLRDLRVLRDADARLAFAAEDIDTAQPMGKFFYVIMLALAELYLEQIKANWLSAKTRAVERGAYISRTPFGYQREDDGRIVPHPLEADHVREAFRLAGLSGVHAAVDYLNREAPVRVWTVPTVRSMLARRVYLGETNSGQFTGKTHEPLVTRRMFELAQHEPARQRVPSADFPLSGFAECGNCGQPMVGGHGGSKSETRIYRCSATTSARAKDVPRCPRGVVIVAHKLEDRAKQEVARILAGVRITVGETDERLVPLERAIEEAEAEFDDWSADISLRRTLGRERYQAQAASHAERIEKLRAAYREQAGAVRDARRLAAEDAAQNPLVWPLVLRGKFASVIVRPASPGVKDRVRFVPLDRDGLAGVGEPESLP